MASPYASLRSFSKTSLTESWLWEFSLGPWQSNCYVQTMAKKLPPEQFQILYEVAQPPEPSWVRMMELPDQPTPLAYFCLPPRSIGFSPDRGYWPHVACLQDEKGEDWLLLQINSFDLANGPGHGWAIPLGQKRTPKEQLLTDLGFREGWEESYPEMLLLFDSQWKAPFKNMLANQKLGLTEEGAPSLYPLTFCPRTLPEVYQYVAPEGVEVAASGRND